MSEVPAMPRRRRSAVALPPNIHAVKVRKAGVHVATYFYYQPKRSTKAAAKRVPLGKDPTDPEFWVKYRKASGTAPSTDAPPGSVTAMITAFRGSRDKHVSGAILPSPEWNAYEPATKRDYGFYLDKIEAAWGPLPAAGVEPVAVLALRDGLAHSPGSANHLIVVGKTLWKWGIPRQYAKLNPFREIATLDQGDEGHWPWPEAALRFVVDHAWPDLARFVFLACQTGQRESDIVRIGPDAKEGHGLWVRPKKTKKRRRALWVPLLRHASEEIDRWAKEPLVFDLERRKAPVQIAPGEAYVLSPAGNPYSTAGLRSRWNRWLMTDKGKQLIAIWTDWERGLRDRDGEEIAPGTIFKPTLHGLRSTAVVTRRLAGYSVQQVSNDIGMSIPMVTRYSRFMDQKAAAQSNILLFERANAPTEPARSSVDTQTGNT